ncbi:hypothetical protein PHMEG_00034149 [Phytophthora megakarya]|uniref:Retrotransposon gag domain-containing protein n=1 Tax=Phytophthora megakarya TaxID=4795 RepID=A0A225URM5_9STRA|nr:hypothetical protein PHMEG_00034149 [Phytophthora megakarya]
MWDSYAIFGQHLLTVPLKPATTASTGNGYPHVTTVQRGVNMGEVRLEPGLKNVPGVVLDQLRATLPAADFARLTKSAKPFESQTKKKTSKSKRTKSSQIKPRRGEDPSDSSESSSSEESSDDSSDSPEDSLDEDTQSREILPSTAGAGTTRLTLRLYVNSATLDMFDEKASISDRKNWWEKFTNKFTNMPVQGGWTNQVKIRELKKKMPSALENLTAEFRREYLKSRTSEPERYFTVRQKSSDSALDFFYRLNEAAVKAGIKYYKSKKEREEHIKRFLKNLKDYQQDRDAVVDGYDSSSSQKRDFRADNILSSRHRPKGRAFVSFSEDEAGWEYEGHVRWKRSVPQWS